MSDHKQSVALATASLLDLIGRAQALQAAIVRGSDPAEVETMRQNGLAVAEAYLDHTIGAARAARALIDGHPDADDLGAEGARRLLE